MSCKLPCYWFCDFKIVFVCKHQHVYTRGQAECHVVCLDAILSHRKTNSKGQRRVKETESFIDIYDLLSSSQTAGEELFPSSFTHGACFSGLCLSLKAFFFPSDPHLLSSKAPVTHVLLRLNFSHLTCMCELKCPSHLAVA